jgi:hypothetical protein
MTTLLNGNGPDEKNERKKIALITGITGQVILIYVNIKNRYFAFVFRYSVMIYFSILRRMVPT